MRFTSVLFALLVLPFAFASCGDDDDGGGDSSADRGAESKSFSKAEQVIDPAKQYTATFKTSKGEFVVKLYADKAPNTVNSFVFLARKGFFDGLTFHRVVKDFVIQTGDPTGKGGGGPGYETKDEPNQLPNKRGTLAMAKTAGAKEFGSQFFVNLKDNAFLDYNNQSGDKFYPFGEVISGMDAVDAIGVVQLSPAGKPNAPETIMSVTIEEK